MPAFKKVAISQHINKTAPGLNCLYPLDHSLLKNPNELDFSDFTILWNNAVETKESLDTRLKGGYKVIALFPGEKDISESRINPAYPGTNSAVNDSLLQILFSLIRSTFKVRKMKLPKNNAQLIELKRRAFNQQNARLFKNDLLKGVQTYLVPNGSSSYSADKEAIKQLSNFQGVNHV